MAAASCAVYFNLYQCDYKTGAQQRTLRTRQDVLDEGQKPCGQSPLRAAFLFLELCSSHRPAGAPNIYVTSSMHENSQGMSFLFVEL